MAAQFRVLDAGTLRTITRGWVRVAGILRRIKTVKVQDGGSLRLVGKFADPLSVSISPSFPASSAFSPPSPQVVSTSGTAVVSGGFAPYTYSWTRVSGNSFTIGSPTSAMTTFSATLFAPAAQVGVYRVTVTDSLGDTSTADATVSLFLT